MARSSHQRRGLLPAALVAGALALGAAAPPSASAQEITDPKLYATSLRVASEALEQYGRYDDREQLERVNDLGYRVAQEANYKGFPLTFHLIDMPEPNAFALPGGHLFVTRGMLELGLTDDMLAALLGHEIGHVALRHHQRMQRKATLMQVLSQVVLVGVLVGADDDRGNRAPYRSPEPYGAGGKGELVQGAAATSLIINELLLRGYSREHEDEADEEGQRWAAAAGFDPLGTQKLMAHMGSRLPQSEEYGYWRTHPFFSDRVRAAGARGELLKRLPPEPADELRQRTQQVLVTYLEGPEIEPELLPLVRAEALAAWPLGKTAEKLRLDRLHELKGEELARAELERDYGRLIRAYDDQRDQVAELTPESAFLATLTTERQALAAAAAELYAQAQAVFADDVFETAFLERFLSNWPQAPEAPEVALRLGDAQARLGQETDAVESYLTAWERAPDSAAGRRAALGLRNLAPRLDRLAALQRLAEQERDPELARLAAARLEEIAHSFEGIENGSEYLRRFPDGSQVDTVRERLDVIADKLYAEVVLYQALGDSIKAVERINKILTHAPLSRAAEQIRDRAVLPS